MSGRLQGKVAVITGAASGIGAETARVFVANGARVVVADFQEEAGKKVAAQLGDAARFIRCDVTKEADVQAAVDLAASAFGQLDVMVNNAGIVGAVGPIAKTSVEAWDATLNVLLRGVFLGMKHAARVMAPRKTGVILSIASTAGVVGGLGPHAYTAAKHGVVGLTKSVASELAPLGIRVNAVAPGPVDTAMAKQVHTPDIRAGYHDAIPLNRYGTEAEIAEAVLFLCSDAASYINGQTLAVDGGFDASGIGLPALRR
jgi:NAD(P)-dependent dehydrogenase (short-subunit alcohol dehydrogenase family)